MGVNAEKKNSGEVFVRMFPSCYKPEKENAPENRPKKVETTATNS